MRETRRWSRSRGLVPLRTVNSVRCREALLSLTNELADPALGPAGATLPKKGAFVQWSERIADHVAPGGSLADVRSHLKTTAKSAWDLAGWLTHAKNASRTEASIVLEAVSHIMTTFVTAVLGKDRRDARGQCPVCGSNRVMRKWDPATHEYTGGVIRCDACGYGQPERAVRTRRPAIERGGVRRGRGGRSGSPGAPSH